MLTRNHRLQEADGKGGTDDGRVVHNLLQLNGQPIQPLYVGHEITYMDYSHGLRLVRQAMIVDGQPRTVQEVLADPVLCVLLSDEGAITDPRYHD